MLHRTLALLTMAAIAGGCTAELPTTAPPSSGDQVGRIIDGDTFETESGSVVRLLQIDTPELRGGECGAPEARDQLAKLLPIGNSITLEEDPNLDKQDRYGRLLRYVRTSDKQLVNVQLVTSGHAAPYLYRSERGAHAGKLTTAARDARAARRGVWKLCPRATLTPTVAWTTGPG